MISQKPAAARVHILRASMDKITITFAKFRSDTGLNGKASKRGSNIKVVDNAFEAYEGGFAGADTPGRVGLTLNLYDACKDWLKKKQSKSAVTGVLIKSANKNLLKRRTAISEVAKACLSSLRSDNKIKGQQASFDTRKVTMLAKGTAGLQPTPLSGDYGTERQTWVGSGKTVAIAGHFHSTQEDLQKLGLNQANFNGLSEKEYSDFLKNKNLKHVLYMGKDVRLNALLDFDGQGLTVKPNTQDYLDCKLPAFDRTKTGDFIGMLWMYAMDSYGNLFGSPNPTFENLKKVAGKLGQDPARMTNFNHSTFNAGREVICAGLIGFTDGYIKWIDNNSGHYKPSRASLKDAIEFMDDEGRDLSQLMVGAYHYLPGGAIKSIEVHTPAHFLNSIDSKGDVVSI
jgi:hypothetical protein